MSQLVWKNLYFVAFWNSVWVFSDVSVNKCWNAGGTDEQGEHLCAGFRWVCTELVLVWSQGLKVHKCFGRVQQALVHILGSVLPTRIWAHVQWGCSKEQKKRQASRRLPFKNTLGTRAVVGMCLPVCFSCKPLACFREDLEFLLGPEKRATRILINFLNVFGICGHKYLKKNSNVPFAN